MRKKSSSHKKNSKSLLSTTIEQIKKDLKGEYNEFQELPLENNINWNQKKINEKKYNNKILLESEKTNDDNNEYINYNNNFNKKKLNINTNNSIYNSKNSSKKKCINNYKLSSEDNITLKKNSNESKLQNQIRDLKIKSQHMKDKLIIFLKLMKKYSFKLTTLTKSNSRNNNSKEKKSIINNEIKSTLSQLNKMLNNPKLNEDIFDLHDLTINNNLTTNNDDMLNLNNQLYTSYNLLTTISNNKNEEEINTNIINSNIIPTTEVNSAENEDIKNIKNEYMKDIEGLIEKYEEKINLLKTENNTLKKNNLEQSNYVNSLIFQISDLKNILKQEKKNYEQSLIKLNNDSISLQKKVDLLQDENVTLKKNCVELSQNLSKINFSEKNDPYNLTNIEKELQHKNNIIKYLENLLRNSGINFNNNYNNILKNKNENNTKLTKTKKDVDFQENDKIDELSKQYFTFYNMNPKSISINTSKNIEMKSSKESNLFSPIVLQQEIDDIDKEIVDLQKQLKQLLNE